MIYTKLTNLAIQVAYKAHSGQTDPCGIPYIFHPYHLAEQMDSETAVCAALLHDVLEDTTVSEDELRQQFGDEITDAVVLLTHRDEDIYEDYLKRIKENPIALAVKKADLAHNTDESRLCGVEIPAERLERWRTKYANAHRILYGDNE